MESQTLLFHSHKDFPYYNKTIYVFGFISSIYVSAAHIWFYFFNVCICSTYLVLFLQFIYLQHIYISFISSIYVSAAHIWFYFFNLCICSTYILVLFLQCMYLQHIFGFISSIYVSAAHILFYFFNLCICSTYIFGLFLLLFLFLFLWFWFETFVFEFRLCLAWPLLRLPVLTLDPAVSIGLPVQLLDACQWIQSGVNG